MSLYKKYLTPLCDFLSKDFPPGSKAYQMRYMINTMKFGTGFVMYYLMNRYQNFSYGAYIYLALHGLR